MATGTAQVLSTAHGGIHKTGNAEFIKLVADADEGALDGGTSVGPALVHAGFGALTGWLVHRFGRSLRPL